MPVHGLALVRDANGRLGRRCIGLTQDEIDRGSRAVTASRAELAWAQRVTVSAGTNGMAFTVIYRDADGFGFNEAGLGPARKAALEAALAGISRVIQGSVPVVVDAGFYHGEPNNLASARATDFATVNGQMVPFALAAQMIGSSLNGGGSDIVTQFNVRDDWDYDPSGSLAPGKEPMMYTAMHEIVHGLGFAGSFDPDSGALRNGAPTPYDLFVGRGTPSAQQLTNRPAGDVRADLVSDDLFFTGPGSQQASVYSIRSQPLVKLYAPGSWVQGSSLSHVDQNTYADVNVGLMTPSSFGAASSQVDGLTASILVDIGYKSAR